MPKHHRGYRPAGSSSEDAVVVEVPEFDVARRAFPEGAESNFGALPPADREQLARDIAEIERATAALRRAEPSLESWSDLPAAAALSKPRPVWLLIGLLWLSAALVTVGAVAAIAHLVG